MKKFISITVLYLAFASLVSAQIIVNLPTNAGSPTTTLTGGLVTLPPAFTPPGTSAFNLTRTFIPIVPLTSATASQFSYVSTPGVANTIVSTSYVNGWGEKILDINRGNNTIKDIVQPYDLRPSMTTNSFLPYVRNTGSYFQLNSFADQRTYNNTLYPAESNRSYSQSTQSYPSGVPTGKSYSPGRSFVGAGNGSVVTTSFNKLSDQIIKYSSVAGQPHHDGYYADNKLIVRTTTAPHNAKMLEYIDQDGREVCKIVYTSSSASSPKLITYYIYDGLGQLAHIVTPQGSILGVSPTADLSTLTHSYAYNKYGSPTVTIDPDQSGPSYTVYDMLNRPVLYQSPLLRAQGKFKFMVYDTRGRVAFSGLYTEHTSGHDHTWWQNAVGAPAPPSYGATDLLNFLRNGPGTAYPGTLPTITDCEIEVVSIYDEYVVPRTFIANSGWIGTTNAVQPLPYMMSNGLQTATLSRIRDGGMAASSDKWTCSVIFYDVKGHVIQTQSLSAANAQPYSTCISGSGTNWDVLSSQYSFAGNLLCEQIVYNDLSTSDKPATRVKNVYDRVVADAERLRTITQYVDGGGGVIIARYTYDDLGRVSRKSLGDIEIQNYDYNIRNQLTGINRNYVDDRCAPANSKNTFGCVLSYDYGFFIPRYDGKISGIVWSGASHTTPVRSYGYVYDAAGRMIHAEFRHYCVPNTYSTPCFPILGKTWNKDRDDFTTSNVTYDNNGNLKSMKMRATGAGHVPINMDDLTYTYTPNTNKLKRVADAVTTDYNLGEFTDVPADQDYTYDPDGNLASDVNKSVTSIVYNEMDLPLQVTYADGSTISNIYTADGTLIKKTMHDVATSGDKVYRYHGPFTYLGDGVSPDKLQFMLHDEGRARYTAASGLFTWDYFVKDHLGNVRSVVTGNITNVASGGGGSSSSAALLKTYLATHEISLGGLEGAIFMNLANVRFNKPIAVTTTDVKAARLNGSDPNRRVGTGIMLKVMAGDRFDLSAKSFWVGNPCAPTTSSSNMATAMLGVLTGAQSSLGMAEGTGAQLVTDAISPGNYAAYQSILNTLSNPFAPRAYINYMVFDEKMNLQPLESGAIQVSALPGGWRNMELALPLRIQKNGYLTVTLSNNSMMDVFIDNVKIEVYQGTLIQEQHYYPFGLAINEGESGTIVKNKFKYQGKEITDMLGAKDLQLYDFGPRQYDPQIGRFWGVDPMSQFPSGYTGMGNDPANMIDPSGCYADGIGIMAKPPAGPVGSFGGAQGAGPNPFEQPAFFVDGMRADYAAFIDALRMNQVLARGGARGPGHWVDHNYARGNDGEMDASRFNPGTPNQRNNLYGMTVSTRWVPDNPDIAVHGVGQPGTMESIVPVWGSGRAAVDDFQNGRYGWAAFNAAMAISDVFLIKSIGTAVGKGIFAGLRTVVVKGGTKVEQYALRAAEDGFYPVMKRGFLDPQELTWLAKGDVWKFGTTKNPLTRYSQTYLDNVGEFGVYYSKEFSGTLQQALTVERMKIVNFFQQNGFLPAGNKIIR